MNADAFRHLYAYHFGINRLVWDQYIMTLTDEQFTQPIGYSLGSVRDQIVHLISVDNGWFTELRKAAWEDPDPLENVVDRATMRARWDEVEQRMRAYLAALEDRMLLTQPITDPEEDKDLFVWQVLIHVMNHGTDHRAQLLRLLTDLGVETMSQDYAFYCYRRPVDSINMLQP